MIYKNMFTGSISIVYHNQQKGEYTKM